MTDAGYLRECFRLGELTETLYWRTRPLRHFRTPQAHGAFDAKCAGERVADVDNGKGHRVVKLFIDGRLRCFLLHRVMWLLHTGAWPIAQLYHKDTDKGRNRLSNFREATHAQNLQNTGPHKDNETGLKGVSCKRGKFYARILANGTRHHLGTFSTKEGAAAAYRAAALKLHGEFARFEK